jgi:hypothetical protein
MEKKDKALEILMAYFDYKIEDYIASGGYGIVNKISKNGNEYAVKIIEKRTY